VQIIIIIITDNNSIQQELTSPLTSMQLDEIVKNAKEKVLRECGVVILFSVIFVSCYSVLLPGQTESKQGLGTR